MEEPADAMEEPPGAARERICVIHVQPSGDPVSPFTHKTLAKCTKISKIRAYHKLKYGTFHLPSDFKDQCNGFHMSCYKIFTAVGKKYVDSTPKNVLNLPASMVLTVPTTRDSRSKTGPMLERSGVFRKICLICGKNRKTVCKKPQKLICCETKNFETKLTESASVLNDHKILALCEVGDFCAKEFRYHDICAKRYMNRAASITSKSTSLWHVGRERHLAAFKYVCEMVERDIIKGKKIVSLKVLRDMYNNNMEEPAPLPGINKMKGYILEEKLLTKYPGVLLVDKSSDDHLLFHSDTKLEPSVISHQISEMARQTELRHAAFELRRQIKSIHKQPLPNSNLTLDHILKGECEIPPSVKSFFEDVVYGPTTSRDSDSKNRRIEALSSDLVFASSGGRTKPRNQIMLGCATKTITGSRKMVNILNRLGHSVSYNTVEEIETELSYSSYNADTLVPSNIIKVPTLYTSVAFDNFDRYVETMTGKDTLHDTVGIVFQNTCETIHSSELPSLALDPIHNEKSRKKRRFEAYLEDLEPYPKKPVFTVNSFIENPMNEPECSSKDYTMLDIIWALNFINRIPGCPMWTGFNAKIIIDQSPTQKVAYLPQINQSPTSYAVVRHTLKQALQVADECGQEEVLCTYDLNIAKMAMEIQSQERPAFNRVFIMLGPFHIEMAAFKALGKIIDGSGMVEALQEAEVIAGGSTNGLIGGTHYNRCKRIHRLMALALRSLHYERFKNSLTQDDEMIDEIPSLLLATKDMRVSPTSETIHVDSKLKNHITEYLKFEEGTIQGAHGKTAQVWMIYIKLIDCYNDFVRSVRMGDINLFLQSLMIIADLFFAMNHQNYARWVTPFIDNIIHSLREDGYIGNLMKNGFFSVKRTQKNFSKTAIDLTLEQTINKDAGNKMKGITSFTNSISARQRWAYSHAQRTEVVSVFLEELGLNTENDVHNEMKPGRIKRHNESYCNLMNALQGMINPFDVDLDPDHLYNICTGKAANEEVYEFLKSVPEIGRNLHLTFREQCNRDGGRFSKPLKRNVIKNFSSENPKMNIRKLDKTCEIKMERNLLGRLLGISMKEKIDMQAVFKFPLTPIPLSLGRNDGSMVKTLKSALIKILEGRTSDAQSRNADNSAIPSPIDVVIVDGFYFIHLRAKHFPTTFGGIAREILMSLAKYKSHSVHLIFDRYVTPSIKELERESRGNAVAVNAYSIMNPHQKRPANMANALRDTNFKKQLASFLFEEWKKNEYHPYFTSFSLYLTVEQSCFLFASIEEQVICREIPSLGSSHEEADSRMVFHLSTINSGNVVVRTCDTDVLVIILGNLQHINEMTNVWMETGTVGRNDHRFIDIRKVAEELGEKLCMSLPAFHALTGCDYTSAFFRVGKKKPFAVLEKHDNLQSTLASFGKNASLTKEEFQEIQSFVCKVYSRKEVTRVDDLRLNMFMDVYGRMSTKDPLKASKGIDQVSLPPCEKVLWNHALRAKFVTKLWTNLNLAHPPPQNAEQFGWVLNNNKYLVSWFTGSALPDKLEEILVSQQSIDEDEDETEDELENDDSSSGEDE